MKALVLIKDGNGRPVTDRATAKQVIGNCVGSDGKRSGGVSVRKVNNKGFWTANV